MPISSRSVIFLCAAVALAQDATKPQFTARELFYSAATDAAPAKPATPAAAPKKAATATPKKAPAPPPAPAPVQSAATNPPSQPVAQHTPPTPLPGGGTLVNTSTSQRPSSAPAPVNGTPLGLKYTILKLVGDDMVEVPPDTIFHNGDKLQLSVQTNGPGYLYVVTQGSSGTWMPIFPSPEVADGNNYVNGWNANVLPPKSRMVMDEPTGTEKLFVVFSRNPEPSLENMIYSLQGGKVKPASAPKADERPEPKQMVQIAMANINDGTVGQLRDTYTRDLIIEKVNDKTPADKSAAEKKEMATYVVNPSGSSDSRVVADISLVHQ